MGELDPQQTGASASTEGDDKPIETIRLRGFFTDPDGGLHRGVPTWVYDEESGEETPVFLEFNTGKIFPRVETPPEPDTTS